MQCMKVVLLAGVLIGWQTLAALAQDWPQWRGPQRDGHAVDFAWPADGLDRLERRWRVQIGEGHASPIVRGEHVYCFSRQGENEVVRCLNLDDGGQRWVQEYAAPVEVDNAAAPHGLGPKSTPALAENAVVTFGLSGILSAWDAADGARRWQQEFRDRFERTWPLFGAAASPLIADGSVVVHVGGHDDGALCAFDLADGRQRWALEGDGPAYSSPLVASFSRTPHLLTQTQKHVVAVDPARGGLLWQAEFTTDYDQNSISPVVVGDLLLVSGYQRGLAGYRVRKRGRTWEPELQWRNPDVSCYMSTPVVIEGLVYGFAQERQGQLFCVDPASGDVVWSGPPRQGENAALVVCGDFLLALTDGASLQVVVPAGADSTSVGERTLADSPTWAHPVPARDGLLIKDFDSLALWSWNE